jgi:hypothetical protein
LALGAVFVVAHVDPDITREILFRLTWVCVQWLALGAACSSVYGLISPARAARPRLAAAG